MADSPTLKTTGSQSVNNGYQNNTPQSAKVASSTLYHSIKTETMFGTPKNRSLTSNEYSPSFSETRHIKNKNSHFTTSTENNMKVATMRTIQMRSNSDSDFSSRDSGTTLKGDDSTESFSRDLNDDVVQNAIFSFTGIQGKYLKKDIITGCFKLDSKAKSLSIIQAGMLLRLSELGYYHDQVESFASTKRGRCAIGLMGQGFISALQNELTNYYGMVAMLQDHHNRQKKMSCLEWKESPEKLTLMKLMVWSVDPLLKLQWLAKIAEACQEKKGGVLASITYSFLSNGDPTVKSLVKVLLLAICSPLLQMLSRWLLEGEIVDPHGEFFVECLSEITHDRLWYDKYRLRDTMLPIFISQDIANKILVTGKSINFLREICEDKTPIKGRDDLRQYFENDAKHIFSSLEDTKLQTIIDNVYLNTSKKVLDIVTGTHKLMDHLQAMRRYLLLGQGDFVGILMENLKSELDKPAKDLFSYDISSILDAALRSTNMQYDDPPILEHLDVVLLKPYTGDTGWNILSLSYKVKGPLSTILETTMQNYVTLFKPLWRMKHMEFLLSSKIWREQIGNAKSLRPMSNELNSIMYRLHLLTAEMIHFINQMQYYILFEVIECSWAKFQEKVDMAKTLDDILNAHEQFLAAIKLGAFVDDKSNIPTNMDNVYLGISRLEVWQEKFFEMCFDELESRQEMQANVQASEEKGKYGVTAEMRLERDEAQKMFEENLRASNSNLEKIGSDCEMAVRQFLLTLNSNNDQNLQLFGIRLDFNEYYKKRDQRLCVPLTFQHLRMSTVFNKSGGVSGRFSTTN